MMHVVLMHHDVLSSRSSHPEGQIRHEATKGIGALVTQEMLDAAKAIEAATQRLQWLMVRPARDLGRSRPTSRTIRSCESCPRH